MCMHKNSVRRDVGPNSSGISVHLCLLLSITPSWWAIVLQSLAGQIWPDLTTMVVGQVINILNSSKYITHKKEDVHYSLPHQDHCLCRKTLLFLQFRFKAVKGSYLAAGMVPCVHRHTGSLCSSPGRHGIIQLVLLAVSGRVPGHKTDDIQILLSSTTKKVV